MTTFDAEAMLADLDSPEATILDGSVLVTFEPREILDDLYEAFVTLN